MIDPAMSKPDAPTCARNREPILAALRDHFADCRNVLEIGSGTGQHAIFFAAALSHLNWQTSEQRENLAGIQAWLDEAALPNTPAPLELHVNEEWPTQHFDAVFSANTLHIMSWAEVERVFARLPEVMTGDARLAVYGPFKLRRAASPARATPPLTRRSGNEAHTRAYAILKPSMHWPRRLA
jgi:cyclopropane fatty-acyl-phospholipid synthase-like methyltransferase